MVAARQSFAAVVKLPGVSVASSVCFDAMAHHGLLAPPVLLEETSPEYPLGADTPADVADVFPPPIVTTARFLSAPHSEVTGGGVLATDDSPLFTAKETAKAFEIRMLTALNFAAVEPDTLTLLPSDPVENL